MTFTSPSVSDNLYFWQARMYSQQQFWGVRKWPHAVSQEVSACVWVYCPVPLCSGWPLPGARLLHPALHTPPPAAARPPVGLLRAQPLHHSLPQTLAWAHCSPHSDLLDTHVHPPCISTFPRVELLGCSKGVSEKAMTPHSSTLAWKISWMEKPCGLQSMGSLRVGHDWATSLSLFTFLHWRRKWQPTPVFLPGESQGRGSLLGCRLWGRTESDMTEAT